MVSGERDWARHDVGVFAGGDTGIGVVPGNKGHDHADHAGGALDPVAARELRNGEKQKGGAQQKEEREEGERGLEGQHGEHVGENGPGQKVDAYGVDELGLRGGVGVLDAEPRDVDGAVGEPEAAVGAEGGGAEGVFHGHLPHAGGKLDEAAVEHGEGDGDVGDGHAAGAAVVHGQHEGRQGEGGEAERRGVGELVGGRGREAGVEGAAEGLVKVGLEELLTPDVDVLVVLTGGADALDVLAAALGVGCAGRRRRLGEAVVDVVFFHAIGGHWGAALRCARAAVYIRRFVAPLPRRPTSVGRPSNNSTPLQTLTAVSTRRAPPISQVRLYSGVHVGRLPPLRPPLAAAPCGAGRAASAGLYRFHSSIYTASLSPAEGEITLA